MMISPNEELAREVGAAMRASDVSLMSAWSFHEDPVEFAVDRARAPGAKWVLVDCSGKPLGMGGFQVVMPGTVEAWMFATPEWPKHKTEVFEVLRVARRNVAMIIDAGVAERVQAHCLADDLDANRFLAAIGLEFEHRLRHFAGGLDANLWSKINESISVRH